MEIKEVISEGEKRFESLKKKVGLFLGPIIFIIIYFIPLPDLTPKAHRLVAILSLVIVWWICEPIPIPATGLLGASLAVIFGIEEARKVFAPFADPVIFLFIGSFIIAESMKKYKLHERFAFYLLSLNFMSKDVKRVLLLFGLIASLISMWVSNTATTCMLFPIGLGVLNVINRINRSPKYSTSLMLMLAYASSVGGIATPVGTPPNIIGIGMIDRILNIKISFFEWMMFALPIVIIMFIFLYFLITILHPPEIKGVVDINSYIKEKKQELGRITKGERNVLIAFSITVLLWILPGFMSIIGIETKWYESTFPEAVVAIIGATLLFLLPINFRRLEFTLEWKDAVKIDWGTIILFGSGLTLGNLMFTTGLGDSIGKLLINITGAKDLFSITALAIGFGIIMSELTSNTASANMVIPIMISIAQAANVNPLYPAIGACIGASYGFMLPISTPPNAIVYGSGLVPITKMLRAGIFFDILGFFIILFGLFIFIPT
ncbi:MAG: DASS family sodium-coupled anion symporter [Candidatus Hydrothermales bacterium]